MGESGTAAFGSAWREDRSDWVRLRNLTTWCFSRRDPRFPSDARDRFARAVLSQEDRKTAEEFRRSLMAARSGFDRLTEFLKLDQERASLGVGNDMSIESLVDRLEKWRLSPERITRWIAFMDRVQLARDSGLGSLIDGVLDGSLDSAVMLPTFDRSYFEAMRAVIFG